MKASGESIATFAIFILSAALITVSLDATNGLENRLTESFKDVEHAADVRHAQDTLISTSYPTAARFTTHEASLDLAPRGGDVEWRYDSLESVPSDGAQELRQSVDSAVNEHDLSLKGPCSVESNAKPGIDLPYPDSEPEEELTLNLGFQDHTVLCTYDNVEASNTRSAAGLVRARDNRYLKLLDNAQRYHISLRSRLSQVPSSVSASVTRCGSPDRPAAEGDANADLERTIRDKFQTGRLQHYAFPDWVAVTDRSILDSGHRLKYGSSTDVYVRSSESSRTRDVGSCGPDNDRDVIETTVTIRPGVVQTKLSLEDSEQKVPGPNGWENIVFTVDPYTQDLSND